MHQETMNALTTRYHNCPSLRAAETPTASEVEEASSRLKIPFPKDYSEFLLRFGAGIAGAYPVFGLRPADEMGKDHWSVIEITERIRAEYRTIDEFRVVDEWVVFSEDHAGNPVGFDSAGKVWTLDHDFGGVFELEADFEAYLLNRCFS